MANKAKYITLSEVKEHLYIGDDGLFRRLKSRFKNRIGQIAGGTADKGYIVIRIPGKGKYRAHRLYYMYYHNIEVLDDLMYIDHRNGNRTDNSKENLRLATHQENCQNGKKSTRNTSGSVGIYWHKRDCRWTAGIGINGKLKNLGYYKEKEDAVKAYEVASLELHGEFSKIKLTNGNQ